MKVQYSFGLLLLAATLLSSGCLTGNSNYPASILRSATGCPERFVPVNAKAASGPGLCASPLKDPADNTLIYLHRSMNGVGDYVVPEGKYGVGSRELLRIDSTGKARGVVRR